jgi:hypothetical protein
VVLDTTRSSTVNDALFQGAEQYTLQVGSLALLTRVKTDAATAKTVDGLITAFPALNPGGTTAPSAPPRARPGRS